jgi:hypothetical protein
MRTPVVTITGESNVFTRSHIWIVIHHLQSQVLHLFPPLLLSIRSSKAAFRNQRVWMLFHVGAEYDDGALTAAGNVGNIPIMQRA